MEATGKLAVKAGNGKGFKIDGTDGWFNATDNVKPFLAKMEKGDEVVVTFEKKGVSRNVTMIKKADGSAPAETSEVKKGTGTKVCDCGKEIKGDYDKCYTCGTKAYKKSKGSKNSYDSPEKTAQIQRGNALNAASYVLSNQTEDPDTLAEMTIAVATKFLEWLRAE